MNAIEQTLQIVSKLLSSSRIIDCRLTEKRITVLSAKDRTSHTYTYEYFAEKFASLA